MLARMGEPKENKIPAALEARQMCKSVTLSSSLRGAAGDAAIQITQDWIASLCSQ